jgi:copper resistance protein C
MRCLLSALFLAVGLSSASAHAFLDHASPRVGSTVPNAPHELTLSFTQSLEPAFSTVRVTGPNGGPIVQGKPRISGSTMRVVIKPSGRGTYHVRWHALSVDTHTTQGSYTFTVVGR